MKTFSVGQYLGKQGGGERREKAGKIAVFVPRVSFISSRNETQHSVCHLDRNGDGTATGAAWRMSDIDQPEWKSDPFSRRMGASQKEAVEEAFNLVLLW